MPGMIDAHVHVYASTFEVPSKWPGTYLAHHAARFLQASLDRGFTTVRDVAGADAGLACALRDGLLRGPRLFYGGRAMTQTGGAADMRPIDHDFDDNHLLGCACYNDAFTIAADGTDALLTAVREEFRRGAADTKIFMSGSVVSPHTSVSHSEYSDAEVLTIVGEAKRAGRLWQPIAIQWKRSGARRRWGSAIEHGTQIDSETAAYVAERGAFVVPTLAIIFAMLEEHESLKLPAVYMDKLRKGRGERALPGLEIMKKAGVKMGLGSDLLGPLYTRQTSEIALRARVLPALDVLRSACAVNAELLGQEGRLGCIRAGAFADLLVVDGNPLQDISILCGAGERLAVIMAAGLFHKRTI